MQRKPHPTLTLPFAEVKSLTISFPAPVGSKENKIGSAWIHCCITREVRILFVLGEQTAGHVLIAGFLNLWFPRKKVKQKSNLWDVGFCIWFLAANLVCLRERQTHPKVQCKVWGALGKWVGRGGEKDASLKLPRAAKKMAVNLNHSLLNALIEICIARQFQWIRLRMLSKYHSTRRGFCLLTMWNESFLRCLPTEQVLPSQALSTDMNCKHVDANFLTMRRKCVSSTCLSKNFWDKPEETFAGFPGQKTHNLIPKNVLEWLFFHEGVSWGCLSRPSEDSGSGLLN